MALSCSRRGPLRYVCGQTFHRTAMIYTFLESSTDLDVHLRTRFAFFGQNRRILRLRSIGAKNNETCSCGPDRRCSSPTDDTFFCFLLLFGVQGIMYSFSFSVSEKSGKIKVQKCKISRLSVLLCRPRNGPLRPVCGHTNHRTTIIHTFLKSPTDLDVHCRK